MATTTEARARDRLSKAVARQHELLAQLDRLVQDPKTSSAEIERTQRQLARCAAEQSRLVADLRLAQSTARAAGNATLRAVSSLAGQRPMREEVLDLLDEIGVPSFPRAISDFALACYGRSLPPERFASLRRDEERAYRKDSTSRPAWVVPAINALGLCAIPRIVASSAWEPERRIVGARSLRTNHIMTLLSLLDFRAHIAAQDFQQVPKELGTLIARYAETVAGATERGDGLDYDQVRTAAEAELARIQPIDSDERFAAAAAVRALPNAYYQLWGRPATIEGEVQERTRSG